MRTLLLLLLLGLLVPAQGTFRTWSYGRPATLDPHLWPDPDLARFLAQIYEPPLRMGLDAEDRAKVEDGPFLWLGSEREGLTVKLTARPGVRFQDDPAFEDGKGRAVGPDDLRFVFLRLADPATKSTYFDPYLRGRIEGLDAWREEAIKVGFADYDAEVSGLKPRGSILEIRLLSPYPQLRPLLTQPWAALMPREAVRRYGSGIAEHPVGTGPFRLDSIDELGTVRMVKNPTYWRAPYPKLDEVRFEVVPRDRQRDRFESGDLDVLFVDDGHRSTFLSRGELRTPYRRAGYHLSLSPSLDFSYLSLNCKNRFLKERGVRRAISLAIDRAKVAETVYGDKSFVADSPIPQGLPEAGMLASAPFAFGGQDLEQARAVLAEAGYPKGEGLPEFLFDVPGLIPDSPAEQAAKGMVADLAKVGIRAQLRRGDMPTFFARAERGDVQIAWAVWFADYPDSENFLGIFRGGGTPLSTSNYGQYQNDVFDRLYADLSQREPGSVRNRVILDAVRILRSDVPVVFLAWPRPRMLLRPEVRGFRYNVLNHSLASVSKDGGQDRR